MTMVSYISQVSLTEAEALLFQTRPVVSGKSNIKLKF